MDELSPGARRRHAPATQRNRDAILEVLGRVLPPQGLVLEVASGTGQHADYMAPQLAPRRWQPSDIDPDALASIDGYRADNGCPEFLGPLALDVMAPRWSIAAAGAIVAINLIHIAPWAVAQGVIGGAGRILSDEGILYFYGPFKRNGRHTAPSNAQFDAALRDEDPSWGVRDLGDVIAEAGTHDLALREVVEMPANNLSVVFVKIG